jgi:hypothetical protein
MEAREHGKAQQESRFTINMKTNTEIELRVQSIDGRVEAIRVPLKVDMLSAPLLESLVSPDFLELTVTLWKIGVLPLKNAEPLMVRLPCLTSTWKAKEKQGYSQP